MTFLTITETLGTALKPVRLLDHPFYAAWSAGELSREDLQFYAGQYYHVVREFPNLLATALTTLDAPAHRRAIVENLAEEEGLQGTSHPELWLRFAEGVGAARDACANAPALPETQEALATLRRLAASDAPTALAALWAVEAQAPEVSAEKMRGLAQFYGLTDARATEYFRVHAVLDVAHSAEEAKILADVAAAPSAAARAETAAVESARALRRVLDGVQRVRGMAC